MTNEVYVSEESFNDNLKNQISMTPQTLQQLQGYGVDEKKELKLEYFFYTNTQEKAEGLVYDLKALLYEVHVKPSADNSGDLCITGWTTKIKMSESIIIAWTKQMCELGYKHDCEFDGWGTNPTQ